MTDDTAARRVRQLTLAAGWLQFGLTLVWVGVVRWYSQNFDDQTMIYRQELGAGGMINGPLLAEAGFLIGAAVAMAVNTFALLWGVRGGYTWCWLTQSAAVVWGFVQFFRSGRAWGVIGDPPAAVRVILSGWPNVIVGVAVLTLVGNAGPWDRPVRVRARQRTSD
jgi:hypothetical protein